MGVGLLGFRYARFIRGTPFVPNIGAGVAGAGIGLDITMPGFRAGPLAELFGDNTDN